MYDNKFLPKLSQNLEVLEDNEFYDITIEVGNDPYVRICRAHMVILNYRSPVPLICEEFCRLTLHPSRPINLPN
ncbi:hypothetical protein RhiirC2_785456 [Rhizophagus irregularis]|uniref:BTB domain-containing protein n=1 Tax=Rhizophagus irregularis TaxID=588596 RepID=A0A2N1MWC1_9GLOM|nr:hypothetical protein RhiirC2_785456 [Rhizophagus irregularis]